MYNGEPKQGKEFYDLLVQSDEFTSELGRMSLASGMIEAEIINYFKRRNPDIDTKQASLGKLIKLGETHELFQSNELEALKMIKEKRNEFVHRIYSLFTGPITVGSLPTSELLDTDVLTYIDYIEQLTHNIEGMTDVIIKK